MESLGLPLSLHPYLLHQPQHSEISTQLLDDASLRVLFEGFALDLLQGLRLLTRNALWIAKSLLVESWL